MIEFMISELVVDEEGITASPASLHILKKSWVCGLLPELRSDTRIDKPPIVLMKDGNAAVVVGHFARIIAAWDLELVDELAGQMLLWSTAQLQPRFVVLSKL